MDIKFEVEGNKFNVRSSCIIKDKEHNKVLLSNMRAITDHEAFLLPGGSYDTNNNRKYYSINFINTNGIFWNNKTKEKNLICSNCQIKYKKGEI